MSLRFLNCPDGYRAYPALPQLVPAGFIRGLHSTSVIPGFSGSSESLCKHCWCSKGFLDMRSEFRFRTPPARIHDDGSEHETPCDAPSAYTSLYLPLHRNSTRGITLFRPGGNIWVPPRPGKAVLPRSLHSLVWEAVDEQWKAYGFSWSRVRRL